METDTVGFFVVGEGRSSLVVSPDRVVDAALRDLLSPHAMPAFRFVLRLCKRSGGDESRPCSVVLEFLGALAVAAPPVTLSETLSLKLKSLFADSLLCAASPLRAAILPDLSAMWSRRDFSVEIKPKGGVMPLFRSATVVMVDGTARQFSIHPLKRSRCRFSLMQYWKHRNSQERSAYCPLDLFSGDPNRMRRAIEALVENPQNNFRYFSPFSGTSQLNVQRQHIAPAGESSVLCDMIVDALLKSPVLGLLRQLQARNVADIELLHQLQEFSASEIQSVAFTANEVGCRCCETGCTSSTPELHGSAFCVSSRDWASWIERELDNFYVATTARDCSLLLTFGSRSGATTDNGEEASSDSQVAHVACIDVDSKRHKSVQHYFEHDQDIVKAAAASLRHAHH